MRTTKGIAFLGTVMLLSWAVAGATIPEAEARTSGDLDVGEYTWNVSSGPMGFWQMFFGYIDNPTKLSPPTNTPIIVR